MKEAVLCVDIGSSSLKAAFMADSPTPLAFASRTFTTTGSNSFALEWVGALKEVIKELKGKSPDTGIEAICISGNGPTIVSEDGTTFMWSKYSPAKVKDSKSLFIPYLLGFKKTFPSQWHNSKKIFGAPEYLIYRLTESEVSILPEKRYEEIYWTKEQLFSEGFTEDDIKKLPNFVPSSALAGKVSQKGAQETGLIEGTLVFCGAPDFIVALIGTNTLSEGFICDRAGSSEGINLCTTKPLTSPLVRTLPSFIPGLWNASVLIPNSGSRFDSFKEKVEKLTGENFSYQNLFKILLENDKKSSVQKIIPTELKQEGIFILQDITQKICEGVNILKEEAKKSGQIIPYEITVTGGQAQNESWCQKKCDLLGMPLIVTSCDAAELIGDNILARTALGYYDSFEEATFALVKKEKIYLPCKNSSQKSQG